MSGGTPTSHYGRVGRGRPRPARTSLCDAVGHGSPPCRTI